MRKLTGEGMSEALWKFSAGCFGVVFVGLGVWSIVIWEFTASTAAWMLTSLIIAANGIVMLRLNRRGPRG